MFYRTPYLNVKKKVGFMSTLRVSGLPLGVRYGDVKGETPRASALTLKKKEGWLHVYTTGLGLASGCLR